MTLGRSTTEKAALGRLFSWPSRPRRDGLTASPLPLVRLVGVALGMLWVVSAQANGVYRCGDTYTNQQPPGQSCQRLQGGHVSVIGAPPKAEAARTEAAPQVRRSASKAERQQAALAVLRAELVEAQARLAQAQAALGQASDDRAAEVAVVRAQDDVVSLQREIKRWKGQSQ